MDNMTVCIKFRDIRGRGIFFGEDPFRCATPVLLAQLSVSSLVSAIFQYFLTPLGESAFISQILSGVVLGPSFMGKNKLFAEVVFPVSSFYISDTLSCFGVMLFLFIVGVKTDLNILARSGKRAVVIGICTFFFPLMLNHALAFILRNSIAMSPTLHKSLFSIASLQSLTSFHVTVCLVTDLKLLNSELGKLAVSASMISGTCSWFWTMFIFTAKVSVEMKKRHILEMMFLSVICMTIIIICVLRPIMLWMVRQIAHEKSVKQSHIFAIFMMVLGCAMFGETMGQHYLFGPIFLGMVVPDGPPLATALINKLDCFISYIFLPIYFVINGARIDFSLIHIGNVGIVELLAFLGFMCKVMASVLPSLYCKMPINDALYLGLIMSAQGIIDVIIFGRAVQLDLIDSEIYSIMVLSAVVFTGAVSPIVKFLYNPSHRYTAYMRRSIQHAKPNAELRLLACIHHQDQTPSIINILEASNPTLKSPICFYVIHLMELEGRVAPLLVAHHPGKKNALHPFQSDHIINAFRLYEKRNQGNVVVNPFTATSPYESMHDEVCSLALDKNVSLIIVPFHKAWTIHGPEEMEDSAIRAVNRNILRKAPCSVGISINRHATSGNAPGLASAGLYSIGVLFLGGRDDREALAYACRMATHPNVGLTVVRFTDPRNINRKLSSDEVKDFEMIQAFKQVNAKNKGCDYQEEVVKDSVGVVSGIRKVENCFDLILVGRRHHDHSTLIDGLTEWNEFPELGFIGDMLASSDSNCKVSVLVVQQQAFVGEDLLDSPKCIKDDSSAVVDIPRDTAMVWPMS